jgi:hypothetical protein
MAQVREDDWEGGDEPAEDDGGPGEHDRHLTDDDEQEVTVKCPACGKRVWADAQRCPKCGNYFEGAAWNSEAAGEPWRVPAWIWWTTVVLLGAVAGWVLAGLGFFDK